MNPPVLLIWVVITLTKNIKSGCPLHLKREGQPPYISCKNSFFRHDKKVVSFALLDNYFTVSHFVKPFHDFPAPKGK